MLDKDPNTRYSTDEVKLHPWIADNFKDFQITEGKKFKEVIEDNSEYYDNSLLSTRKLKRDSSQFTSTKNLRRTSVLRNSDKNRRLSSRPDQIAKRLSKIQNSSDLPIVKEGNVFDSTNYSNNAFAKFEDIKLGDNLSVPGLKRPATTMNDFTTIDIIVPSRKTPNRKETTDSVKSKIRSSKTIRKHTKHISQMSKTDNFLILERKF